MDLVYGHLGIPVYDTESKKWHFTRNPQSTRHFHPICQLFKTIATERHAFSDLGTQQQLLKAYPEYGGSLLLEHARLSETVTKATSQYDPTVSDLLVFGSAVDATHPKALREIRYKPILAVASGAAGELVKLIVLNQQHLGWNNDERFKVESLTARGGEEGWWKGNGSSIKQLVFAGNEKQASTWLAVRYQGAISVLKPILQLGMICPSNAEGQIRDLPVSRLDANHIITLTSQDASGIPFADVTFNPWNSQQFAVINQRAHWHIWNMKAQIKSQGLWTLEKASGDSLVNDNALDHDISEPILDGWAKVLWASDADTLVIANRRNFAIFDVKAEPMSLDVPDLGLEKSSDWILDIKRTLVSTSHLLVVTSSRLFLLEARRSGKRQTSLAAATILVSWVHFRPPEDISLSVSIFNSNLQDEASRSQRTTAVVIYSRLNSLASVFTFQHSNITGRAVSRFDPCLLPIAENALFSSNSPRARNNKQSLNGLLCLQMTPVLPMTTRKFKHQDVLKERSQFFLLRMLCHDKSMSEYLYIGSAPKTRFLEPPDIQMLVGLKKTPARINDDFIVSDGVVDESEDSERAESRASHHPLSGIESPERRKMVISGKNAPVDLIEPRTMEMDWLVGVTNKKERSSRSQSFENYLESIQDAISAKLSSTTSGAETLLELSETDPLVTDIDTAATTLTALLETIARLPSNETKAATIAPESRAIVSASLTQALGDTLDLSPEPNLLQVYESLIKSQIVPLPPKTPSRVRIAMEKQLRPLAAQLCLAAFTVRIRMEAPAPKGVNENDSSTQESTFAIPVRWKGPTISLSSKGKEAVTKSSSEPLSSAPLPQPSSSQPVPTSASQRSIRPETPMHGSARPTPLQAETATSKTTKRNFSEDPSSINLRALVSLDPQPLLPPKLSNILSHWSVGEDPATYDWVAAQRATALPDSEAMAAEQARQDKAAKKAKKRARTSTLRGTSDTPYARAAEGDVQSQPDPKRVIESNSQAVTVVSSQMPESSQMGAAVSSQPLAGRFAGGQKGLKAKKGRKRGF